MKLVRAIACLVFGAILCASSALSQDIRQEIKDDPELLAQCMFACSSNADCAARFPDIERYCLNATLENPDKALWECLAAYQDVPWDQAFTFCRAR